MGSDSEDEIMSGAGSESDLGGYEDDDQSMQDGKCL